MVFIKDRKRQISWTLGVGVLLCLMLMMGMRWYTQTTTQHVYTGETMGTTYTVKAYFTRVVTDTTIHAKIEDLLRTLNQQMSTYDPDSQISQFNNATKTEWVTISPSFFDVLTQAKTLYKITQGAWDPTIKPLVDLWGFSDEKAEKTTVPTATQIQKAKAKVGFSKVVLASPNKVRKTSSEVTIDLSSIAKGYGVDQVVDSLQKLGANALMVEIGGEVFARGKKPNNKAWTIGIQHPEQTGWLKKVTLDNRACATSGDYRQYISIDGKKYSHLIDPRTGWPVDHATKSVSVIAKSCAWADGLATAFMILAPERVKAWQNTQDDVDVILITQEQNGALKVWESTRR